jgi:hypothetical protein
MATKSQRQVTACGRLRLAGPTALGSQFPWGFRAPVTRRLRPAALRSTAPEGRASGLTCLVASPYLGPTQRPARASRVLMQYPINSCTATLRGTGSSSVGPSGQDWSGGCSNASVTDAVGRHSGDSRQWASEPRVSRIVEAWSRADQVAHSGTWRAGVTPRLLLRYARLVAQLCHGSR